MNTYSHLYEMKLDSDELPLEFNFDLYQKYCVGFKEACAYAIHEIKSMNEVEMFIDGFNEYVIDNGNVPSLGDL